MFDTAPATSSLLSEALRDDATARPDKLDALFRLARRRFLAGEGIDMGSLAREAGIGRVTLYRWVGGYDALMAEIVWSIARPTHENLERVAPGRGARRLLAIFSGFAETTIASPAMRAYLQREGDAAMRLLTLSSGQFLPRMLAMVKGTLAVEVKAGHFRTPLKLDDLAYAVVRINESYIYRQLITGEPPDPAGAKAILRLILR